MVTNMLKRPNQQGFVTMILTIIVIIVAILVLTYLRVSQVQH